MPWTPAAHRTSRLRRWWRRRVLAHRRPLAALCAAGTVGAVLLALQPAPPATTTVPVAARDLAAGTVLAAGDVVQAELPRHLAPAGIAGTPSGRTLAAPVRQGEALTDRRLLTPDLLAGYPGLVGVTARIADPAVAELLAPGDTIDLVVTDPAAGHTDVVARAATVVALPPDPAGTMGSGSTPAGRAVLLGVRPEEVSPVSVAAVSGFISVVFRH